MDIAQAAIHAGSLLNNWKVVKQRNPLLIDKPGETSWLPQAKIYLGRKLYNFPHIPLTRMNEPEGIRCIMKT